MPLTRDAIVETFHGYGRPRARWLVGGEFERHVLDAAGKPAPYFGRASIRTILDAFTDRGWKPYREGPHPVALLKDGASITLEPGAQLELSGAPHRTVQAVIDEAQAFHDAVDDVIASQGLPLHQAALGYTPVARIGDIGWVPKGRYVVMREHLGQTGPLAHHMMKGTAATQASFDFANEADCARKVKLSSAVTPLVLAMFANSPLTDGRPNGFQSFRGHIWTQTDPARTGLPTAAHSFSYEAWIDYLLDVPMMFVVEQGQWKPAGGRSFRAWMEAGGPDGPTWSDWDLHLTSVFPEVRVKKQIEVRTADCVPLPLAGAFVALFTGLFYCARAGDLARGVAERFIRFGTREERFDIAARHGLRGTLGGRTLADWSMQLLEAADDGLSRCSPEDQALLKPLTALVSTATTPADLVLRAFAEADGDMARFLPRLHPSGEGLLPG